VDQDQDQQNHLGQIFGTKIPDDIGAFDLLTKKLLAKMAEKI
jgi:hypothetical protein